MGQKGNLFLFICYTLMPSLEIFGHQEAIILYFSNLNVWSLLENIWIIGKCPLASRPSSFYRATTPKRPEAHTETTGARALHVCAPLPSRHRSLSPPGKCWPHRPFLQPVDRHPHAPMHNFATALIFAARGSKLKPSSLLSFIKSPPPLCS
jgi:hypothetical protein